MTDSQTLGLPGHNTTSIMATRGHPSSKPRCPLRYLRREAARPRGRTCLAIRCVGGWLPWQPRGQRSVGGSLPPGLRWLRSTAGRAGAEHRSLKYRPCRQDRRHRRRRANTCSGCLSTAGLRREAPLVTALPQAEGGRCRTMLTWLGLSCGQGALRTALTFTLPRTVTAICWRHRRCLRRRLLCCLQTAARPRRCNRHGPWRCTAHGVDGAASSVWAAASEILRRRRPLRPTTADWRL